MELKLQQCRLDSRYDIQECLGRGSYAEIYVAHDIAAHDSQARHVVIKALNVWLQGGIDIELERTLIDNFQNEAIALDRVRHPNIISRLGHGTAIDLAGKTFHYLVLEYMPGGDLATRCREQAFTLKDALFYLEQVCAGLAHAHLCGVIHRDIKPQNLLLTADQQTVKIADFGVAKIEASEGAITRVGTNVYAPPEHNPLVQTGSLDAFAQISSAQVRLTPAADIYSLAKTTYTLLAGESPRRFSHHQITELPTSIANEYWAASVLRILRRATEPAPQDRYQTVEEFWNELSDAALAPTQLLKQINPHEDRFQRSADLLNRAADAPTVAPPPPHPKFDATRTADSSLKNIQTARPRIVVRVNEENEELRSDATHRPAQELIAAMPDVAPSLQRNRQFNYRLNPYKRPRRWVNFLVAVTIITAFIALLLAMHRYFFHDRGFGAATSSAAQPAANDPSIIGREAVVTGTDVNLRPDPSLDNPQIGVAEEGSRVRVLNVKNEWCEVYVVKHGREKTNRDSKDQGWLKRRFLSFD